MSEDRDTAMAELRRVCSGDRTPPPPPYRPILDPFGRPSRNPIGAPSNDPWPARGTSSINWAYIAIVVLCAATAGALVYSWSHP